MLRNRCLTGVLAQRVLLLGLKRQRYGSCVVQDQYIADTKLNALPLRFISIKHHSTSLDLVIDRLRLIYNLNGDLVFLLPQNDFSLSYGLQHELVKVQI